MPDRSYPAVDALVRRVQRVAAQRPDPGVILAKTITLSVEVGMDPYAVLGLLIEGSVHTLVGHIPKKNQAEAAAMLRELLDERLKAAGIGPDD